MRPVVPMLLLAACAGPATTRTSDSGPSDRCPVGGADVGFDVGACAPDFTLPDHSGAMVSLSDQRGKVALVDISAVW